MTRNNKDPTWRGLLELPAPIALCMVLVGAILAKSGYPLFAIGGVATFQILYSVLAYAISRAVDISKTLIFDGLRAHKVEGTARV